MILINSGAGRRFHPKKIKLKEVGRYKQQFEVSKKKYRNKCSKNPRKSLFQGNLSKEETAIDLETRTLIHCQWDVKWYKLL